MDPVLKAFGEAVKEAMMDPNMDPNFDKPKPLSSAGWRRAAKDIPIAALASGAGYGVGRTLAELWGERTVQKGQQPAWIKHLPIGLGIIGMAGGFASSRAREIMKKRRDEA